MESEFIICLLIYSSDEEEEEEEMLISEEEIPFKDDPRDETYKPHLERHVLNFTVCASEKHIRIHGWIFCFIFVPRLNKHGNNLNE